MFTYHYITSFNSYNIQRDDINFKYFDYSKNTNKLPLIDRKKYPEALLNLVNEVSLLKSVYEHPAVYSAKAISGQEYKVESVFENKFGYGKTVVVVLANKDENKNITLDKTADNSVS